MSELHIEHATDARNGALLIETVMSRADEFPCVYGKADRDRVRTMVARVISDPQYALFVAYVNDKPILFIAGYLCKELYNHNLYGCIDLILSPDKAESSPFMLKALHDSFDDFARWAFDKGAKRITAGHTNMSATGETIEKLLLRWGYVHAGRLFVLEAA